MNMMVEGIKYPTAEVFVTVATSSGVLLPGSADRIGLIISAPPVNRCTFSINNPVTLDQGITLYPGQGPLLLSAAFYGDWVTKPLLGIAVTLAQTVGIIQVFKPGVNMGSFVHLPDFSGVPKIDREAGNPYTHPGTPGQPRYGENARR